MSAKSSRQVLRIAAGIQRDASLLGLGARPPDSKAMFDALVTEPSLRRAARQLFMDGHHAQAVEQAYKCLNNLVKRRAGIGEDGAKLMRRAFSRDVPILRINDLKTDSDRDEQQGYMDIAAGCMTGIRNPRAHEDALVDEAAVGLEMLVWANHMIRVARTAKRSRASKKVSTP